MIFKSIKTKYVINFIILILIMSKKTLKEIFKKKEFFSYNNLYSLKINNLSNILYYHIKKNTILIFENNNHHYECTPGYSKYFIDLGYNVDIIMHSNNRNNGYC